MTQQVIFSSRELCSRIDKAQGLLRKSQIDSLFLTMDENFHYFTGGAGMTHTRNFTRPSIVIVPAEGEPIAIIGGSFAYTTERAGLEGHQDV